MPSRGLGSRSSSASASGSNRGLVVAPRGFAASAPPKRAAAASGSGRRAETIVGARAARARLAREIRRDERCLPSGGAHPRRTPSALDDDDDEEEEEEEEEDEGGKGAARGRRGEDEGGEDGTSTDADPLGDRFAWTPASDGESDDYYAATVAAGSAVMRMPAATVATSVQPPPFVSMSHHTRSPPVRSNPATLSRW